MIIWRRYFPMNLANIFQNRFFKEQHLVAASDYESYCHKTTAVIAIVYVIIYINILYQYQYLLKHTYSID